MPASRARRLTATGSSSTRPGPRQAPGPRRPERLERPPLNRRPRMPPRARPSQTARTTKTTLKGEHMYLRIGSTAALLLALPFSAHAALNCVDMLKALSRQLVDATRVKSGDLTTKNEQTTPQNDSLPGLPPFAFTPRADRDVISPSPAK